MHPVKRLLAYAANYRRDFWLASLYSVLNKFFDILPEVLIGAAVDVVVKGDQSFLARNVLGFLGITSTWHQLLALGVRDMARSRLVLEVHSPSAGARERYGRSSATATTTDQLRAQEIRARIEHDHARRQVQRAMKQWTGPDGPADV